VVDAIYTNKEQGNYIHFKTTEESSAWQFMMQILVEYYEKKSGFNTAIRGLMLLLFNELLRDYQKYLPETEVRKIDNSIVIKILDYVKLHNKTVTLKELSEIFNYNSDYLGKMIKNHTGKPLTDILRELKFKQAEYLLLYTNMPIVEIVHEVGYSNVSYFYKQFKEVYGSTPDEYRKQENSI